MDRFYKLCGFVLIAALSGCAQNLSVPQFSVFGGGNDSDGIETASLGEDGTAEPGSGDGPPLPVRNLVRKTDGDTQTASSSDNGETQQAGLALPNLSDVKLFTATAYAPKITQWDDPPITVYTQLAQQIRACWFKPAAPKLTNHGFHADVAPGSTSATIIIYQKDPNGKRGLQAFRISIDSNLTGSTVTAQNRRLDKPLDVSFRGDLASWASGGRDCKTSKDKPS